MQLSLASQFKRIDNHKVCLQQLLHRQQMSDTVLERISNQMAAMDNKLGTLLPQAAPPIRARSGCAWLMSDK